MTDNELESLAKLCGIKSDHNYLLVYKGFVLVTTSDQCQYWLRYPYTAKENLPSIGYLRLWCRLGFPEPTPFNYTITVSK